jgi:hypothetical protein
MMMRTAIACSVLLLALPTIGEGQGKPAPADVATNCAAALAPLVLFSDPWLPREVGGGRLPFGGGPKPWELVVKEMKEPGQPLIDLSLEFNDKAQAKAPKAEYLISTRALVRVAMPSVLGPDSLAKGAATVGDVLRVIRRWACNAPTVRVVAEGVAGLHVRAYLQSANYQQDIGQLVNIGVPHHGGILQEVVGRLGVKASKPCLAQLGLNEGLASPTSPQFRAYLAAIAPTRPDLDRLNRAQGAWRPLPLGLEVIDLVVDADSLRGRTADCSRAWAFTGSSDNGIATVDAQRFPVAATADLRPSRVMFVRGLSAATIDRHPLVARAIRDAVSRPMPSVAALRPVKDSLLSISFRPGLRSGSDEALVPRSLILRRLVDCTSGGRCAESDTAILFTPGFPLEALRLPRLDSLRRTTLLPVYSATQVYSTRPAYQALVIDHYRGPTYVVVDSAGRLGKVDPRAGVFPNGLRGVPSESLCLQGEGRVEGPAGAPGTVRALSTLRLCSQVKPVVAETPVSTPIRFPVPRFAEWLSEVDVGFRQCSLQRDVGRGTPADSIEGFLCSDSTEVDSLRGRPREVRFLTRPGRKVQLGKGTIYIIVESEMSRLDGLAIDFGILYGDAKNEWIPLKAEDRRTWSVAISKTDRPEAWDPESSRYAMGRFAFYQVDVDLLNSTSTAKSGGRRETLPDLLEQIAIRVQNAIGPVRVRVIAR